MCGSMTRDEISDLGNGQRLEEYDGHFKKFKICPEVEGF